MNERIREVWIKAAREDSDPDNWDTQEQFIERFAELIIQEAIGLCRVDVDALTGPFLPEYEKGIVEGYRRANENLRFYFGVE